MAKITFILKTAMQNTFSKEDDCQEIKIIWVLLSHNWYVVKVKHEPKQELINTGTHHWWDPKSLETRYTILLFIYNVYILLNMAIKKHKQLISQQKITQMEQLFSVQ